MNDHPNNTTTSSDDYDRQYHEWLERLWASRGLASFRNDSKARQFVADFVHQIHTYNQQLVLACRGQERTLQPYHTCNVTGGKQFAFWFDFLQVADTPRRSGPLLQAGQSRFTTVSVKVHPGYDNNKGRRKLKLFGMTDDTGYLFPCLQHYVPRACFFVLDHALNTTFILHGNQKFAGQGDDGMEEDATTSTTTTSTTTTLAIQNPPCKCFPGTQHLTPSYYIMTWKANGKNAGVFGYTPATSADNNNNVYLFVNSKGVCECVGLLDQVMNNPHSATFSDMVQRDDAALLPHIFHAFVDVWNDTPLEGRSKLVSLWNEGYLVLMEFCDNKHIVLEQPANKPHLAFIGLVQQPPAGSIDTFKTGLVFHYQNQFTFEYWRNDLQAPAYSSKPTVRVRAPDLNVATKAILQGTFFQSQQSPQEWFDPSSTTTTTVSTTQFLTGEGAVGYEIVTDPSTGGHDTIRQLFKAKTASYITHRQMRGFLTRPQSVELLATASFDQVYQQVHQFCRKRFGTLNPDHPYPNVPEFCSEPARVVQAAASFYTHFALWVHEMALQWNSTVAKLVNFMGVDSVVDADSPVGKEYSKVATAIGLPISVTTDDSRNNNNNNNNKIAIRCGMAFRVAEFCHLYNLQPAQIFAAPNAMLQQLSTSLDGASWTTGMPTGYNCCIIYVGFQHVFPQGVTANAAMDKESRKRKKEDKKKEKSGGSSVLEPFQKAFQRFLMANPGVKMTIGNRNENSDMFVLLSEGKELLLSCPTAEEFSERLTKLPKLESSSETQSQDRILPEQEAVAQAVKVLQPIAPTLQDLFQPTARDLTFGFVFGRLVPIIAATDADKYMLIIRGYPGLGKSTVAKALQQLFGNDHHPVPVIEADSYFGPNCPFHPELLSEAHNDAQNRAQEALADSQVQLVVVSNTSTQAAEYAQYIRLAQASMSTVAVAVLTLDTKAPLDQIENIHDVPLDKVQKMAKRLRLTENNPEGKTLERIFEIADSQQLATDNFPQKKEPKPLPVLVWSLLESSGLVTIDEIWHSFVHHADAHNISVSDKIVRPVNPHVTQLYIRSTAPLDEIAHVQNTLWEYHGTKQELRIGQVRYAMVDTDEGSQKRFVNMAVQVVSLSPELPGVTVPIPHVTIAYDPEHAQAADSNSLWASDDDGGTQTKKTNSGADNDQKSPTKRVDVFEYELSQGSLEISSIVEVGVYRNNAIFHELPNWAMPSDKKA